MHRFLMAALFTVLVALCEAQINFTPPNWWENEKDKRSHTHNDCNERFSEALKYIYNLVQVICDASVDLNNLLFELKKKKNNCTLVIK